MELKTISDSEKEAFVTITLDKNTINEYSSAKSKRRKIYSAPAVNFSQCFHRVKLERKKNCIRIFLVAFLWISVNMLMNQFRVHRTKKVAKGAMVSMDYSDVKSLDDLETMKNNLDSICFVSCKNMLLW
jgi:hypothetical protein